LQVFWPRCQDVRAFVREVVGRANREVWSAAQRDRSLHGMGATLTLVCIHGDEAHVAEVGDSRAYLLRAGTLIQLTRDQTLVQMLVDNNVLTSEGAQDSPFTNVLTEVVGGKADVQPSVGSIDLYDGDRLLVCSDGLFKALEPNALRDALTAAPTPANACEALVSLANARGGEDNATAVVAFAMAVR
jgi:serine/threonine protein phosphatase PrpC